MADQNSGVVNMGSRLNGDEAEGMTSLSSAGSGHPRGVNEAGTAIPTGYEGQGNGVRMPGPMSSGYEDGWLFNDDGDDPRGVQPNSSYIQGVQLPGGPNEEGWNYGLNYSDLHSLQSAPDTNQNFGVVAQQGIPDGDDEAEVHVVGRMSSNYDGVTAADIMAVFGAIVPDGGQGAISQSGPVMGHDSMGGIVLGPGSGPYTGGEQNSFSTGDLGDH